MRDKRNKTGKHRTGRHGLVAALDVGSSKVTCFIARLDAGRDGRAPQVRVLGIGHQISSGIRCGTIVDMERAEEAIRAAVESAERMADVTVEDVVLAFATGGLQSQRLSCDVAIAGHDVSDQDLKRVLQRGHQRPNAPDREVVHAIPVSYSIDGSPGIRDPRGMYGERLGVMMHVVTAASAPLRNLLICVERCHLRVLELAVAPYASGLSALVEDEMDLGATCIDMGAGTTSFSIFRYGHLVACDIVPVGGAHVTTDIARGLSTTMIHAERIKTLHGSALAGGTDDREMVAVPLLGEEATDEVNRVPRSMLTGIIRPRLEETFELVRDRLLNSNCEKLSGRRVVLTGGASQMNGAREIASRILERQVRVSAPLQLPGVASATAGPAFATVAGLLQHAMRPSVEAARAAPEADGKAAFAFGRLGRWLRENF